ncbi:hypothetical protein NDU88_012739 [Pleurodeles waltl]|uniref:Uncharacterized protein n=1 Tax=Pleurodeles waltl TaxID=8319 RepID=A0AAV7R0Y0_PLEWA|nr:hypothetical protein NDU88_012739 [Pleurodeles waltl]
METTQASLVLERSPRPGDLKVGAVPSPAPYIRLAAVQWAGDVEEGLAGVWPAGEAARSARADGRATTGALGRGPVPPLARDVKGRCWGADRRSNLAAAPRPCSPGPLVLCGLVAAW